MSRLISEVVTRNGSVTPSILPGMDKRGADTTTPTVGWRYLDGRNGRYPSYEMENIKNEKCNEFFSNKKKIQGNESCC